MGDPGVALFEEDGRPLVAMFRSPVFNASETFIRAQAARLERYQALVVGLEDKGNVPDTLTGRVLLAENAIERLEVRFGRWGRFGARIGAQQPALVHAQFGTDGVLALRLTRRLGVPLVTTLRGYEVSRRRMIGSGRLSWMRYALGRQALTREGSLFLTVSNALRRRALAQGFPEERTFVHYNGVDPERFAGPRSDDGKTVLHVARLVEKKGTAVLLRAVAKIPSARLIVIGDGPLKPKLQRLAGDRVQFLGHQPPEVVADWMRRAALLAAPSLTARDGDAEGLPNVVVEAMAAGLPVVGTDHEGIPEAVSDGETGFVVPEGEAEPLAKRIGDLLEDSKLREQMGAAGRALARDKFDFARQMRLLETRYDAVTSSRATETR